MHDFRCEPWGCGRPAQWLLVDHDIEWYKANSPHCMKHARENAHFLDQIHAPGKFIYINRLLAILWGYRPGKVEILGAD